MTTNELQRFFGTIVNATNAIGISRQTFFLWKKKGYIPIGKQREFELMTNGKLIAKPKDARKYDYRNG